MYYMGYGVPQDYVYAYMWAILAASKGEAIGIKNRDEIAQHITPAQVSQAQALAREWLPRFVRRDDKEVIQSPSQLRVPLEERGGTFTVLVKINSLPLNFTLDSGASDVSVPADVFSTLRRTGSIQDTDILGTETYVLADGRKVQSITFRIRSLQVGSTTIENVKGSVAPSEGGPLLGQSFLRHFKSFTVDNKTHELVPRSIVEMLA